MKPFKSSTRFFILMAAVVLTAFVLGGCGGGGGSSSGSSSGGTSGTPSIATSPDSLSFGNVVVATNPTPGVGSADRSVQVTNAGTADLVIGQMAPLAAPFSIVENTCSGASLAPNASCTVDVRFTPTSASPSVGSFNIPSNDPNKPTVTVNMSGDGKGLNVTINKVDTSGVSANGGPVKVLVTVTDGDNNAVSGLLQGAFAVSENGGGRSITNFANTVQVPVSVALDMDYSQSVIDANNQGAVQAAAKAFLDQLSPTDEAAVIAFASEVLTTIDFTLLTPTGLQDVKAAIGAGYTGTQNGTLLYDAMNESVTKLASRTNDARAAVVLSDGDNEPFGQGTGVDLDTVIQNAKDNNVIFYTIGFTGEGAGGELRIVREPMQRAAVETGGLYFEAPTTADLDAIYTQISQILSDQYEITFMTTQLPGSSNTLVVTVVDGPRDGAATKVVTY
jgi:VWFA-related protein